MKRFQFISRLATSVAAVALTIGTAVTFSACTEEDNDVNNVPEIVKLATPQNAEGTVNGADITFQWDSVEGAVNYAAQIRHSQYGDIVAETITELNYTTFADLENGVYFFRVRANHELVEDQNSDWSAWVEKVVAVDPEFMPLDTPKDVVCVANENTTSSLTFKWEVVENAATYTYKVSDAEGNEVLVAETEALQVKVENLASNATYTFVVKANPAVDSEGLRSSSYSKAATGTTVGLLATPAELEVSLRMAEALSFRWAEVENAAAYAYELYEGDMNGEPVVAATTSEQIANVETTNTTASFMGLKKDTYYSFRIKAVPAEGANFVESAFTDYVVVKTLITDATPILAPVVNVVTTQISATISWNAVSGAASYQLQWGATEAEAEASEPIVVGVDETTGAVSTEYVVKNLTASTDYVVRVMACSDPEDTTKMNSEYTAWIAVKTLDLLSECTVSTADELLNVFKVCKPGAVVTIKSGNYVTDKTITLEFAIQFIGESATNRPVINLKEFTLAPAADEGLDVCSIIKFQNIEFTDYKITEDKALDTSGYIGGYFINNSGMAVNVENLVVDNCVIGNGFKSAFMRLNRVNFGVKNLTVTNNIVAVGGNDGAVVAGNGKTYPATKWEFKNNTFEVGDIYGASKYAQMMRFPTSDAASFDVVVENNTFHNMACLKGKNILEGAPSSLSFKKNVITIPDAMAWAKTAGITASETVVYADNFIWAGAEYPLALDGFTNVDPAFTAYSFMSNYVPTNADVIAAGAGDPRWLK